jgi:hypothetical protein
VVNVLSHDRHLTPLGPSQQVDTSGIAYLSDGSPFSVGNKLSKSPYCALFREQVMKA